MVSSAVYRYVESRDELLTLLLIDAFGELGDEVDAAVAQAPEGDHGARFLALGRAVREWAVREPASYALLFGSPVPGYSAPAERTTGPGTRVIVSLIGILDAASRAGQLSLPAEGSPQLPPTLAADLAAIRSEYGLDLPEELVARGVLVWSSLSGAVSFEVFNQYGRTRSGLLRSSSTITSPCWQASPDCRPGLPISAGEALLMRPGRR